MPPPIFGLYDSSEIYVDTERIWTLKAWVGGSYVDHLTTIAFAQDWIMFNWFNVQAGNNSEKTIFAASDWIALSRQNDSPVNSSDAHLFTCG